MQDFVGIFRIVAVDLGNKLRLVSEVEQHSAFFNASKIRARKKCDLQTETETKRHIA